MRPRKGSVAAQILTQLRNEPEGLMVGQVFKRLTRYVSKNTCNIYISTLVKRGLIQNHGKTMCECCFTIRNAYRITKQGKDWLDDFI